MAEPIPQPKPAPNPSANAPSIRSPKLGEQFAVHTKTVVVVGMSAVVPFEMVGCVVAQAAEAIQLRTKRLMMMSFCVFMYLVLNCNQ